MKSTNPSSRRLRFSIWHLLVLMTACGVGIAVLRAIPIGTYEGGGIEIAISLFIFVILLFASLPIMLILFLVESHTGKPPFAENPRAMLLIKLIFVSLIAVAVGTLMFLGFLFLISM